MAGLAYVRIQFLTRAVRCWSDSESDKLRSTNETDSFVSAQSLSRSYPATGDLL